MRGAEPAVEKPDAPRRRKRRWVLAILAACVLACAAALLTARARLDEWARSAIEQRVAEATGAELRLGGLQLRLRRLKLRQWPICLPA